MLSQRAVFRQNRDDSIRMVARRTNIFTAKLRNCVMLPVSNINSNLLPRTVYRKQSNSLLLYNQPFDKIQKRDAIRSSTTTSTKLRHSFISPGWKANVVSLTPEKHDFGIIGLYLLYFLSNSSAKRASISLWQCVRIQLV